MRWISLGRHRITGSEEPEASQQLVTTDAEDEENNVFRVLGAQARSRSLAQLWVAALGGAIDAGLLWWRHPMLGWLAAGCAAVAAYGVWGLLDRRIETRSAEPSASPEPIVQLGDLRDLTAVVGTAAALWAVLSFMAVALGNWNH
jgi:hypothetical protein